MPVPKKSPKPRAEFTQPSRGEGNTVTSKGKTRAPRCFFCMDYSDPHYLTSSLGRYLTEKGKIIPQTRTGLCHKHQRLATTEIKKARYMALLPFTTAIR